MFFFVVVVDSTEDLEKYLVEGEGTVIIDELVSKLDVVRTDSVILHAYSWYYMSIHIAT